MRIRLENMQLGTRPNLIWLGSDLLVQGVEDAKNAVSTVPAETTTTAPATPAEAPATTPPLDAPPPVTPAPQRRFAIPSSSRSTASSAIGDHARTPRFIGEATPHAVAPSIPNALRPMC